MFMPTPPPIVTESDESPTKERSSHETARSLDKMQSQI